MKTTQKYLDAISEGVEWLSIYEKESRDLRWELLKQQVLLECSREVINEKNSIAIYGVSQVGKSTFMSQFIGNERNELEIIDESSGKTFDFINRINPLGRGNEATGVVTRFSTSPVDGNNAVGFKLFSPIDIVIILIDSYFNDFSEGHPEYRSEDIDAFFESFQPISDKKNGLGILEWDVHYLRYYLEYYLKENLLASTFLKPFIESDFWFSFANKIAFLSEDELIKSFQLFWGNNDSFNSLWKELFYQVKNLGFSSTVFGNIDLILRDGGRIMDVKLIKDELFEEQSVGEIKVFDSNGQVMSVQRSFLSFLVSEVVLQIPEIKKVEGNRNSELKNFVSSNYDFIDFPGSRNREKFPLNEVLDIKTKREILLRGKVDYLFNKYDVYNKIDLLFVGTKVANHEVKDFNQKLSKWIDRNIGASETERGKLLSKVPVPPLFVLIMHWDNVLDSPEVKTELRESEVWSRVEASLNESVYLSKEHKARWSDNWSAENQKFHNTYTFRSIKYSGIYPKSGEGEEYLSDSHNIDVSSIKSSFLSSVSQKAIFGESRLDEIWDSGCTPNKDGTELILERLNQNEIHDFKKSKLHEVTDRFRGKSYDVLNRYYDSEDHSVRLDKSIRILKRLNKELEIGITNGELIFGRFMDYFKADENEIFNLIHETISNLNIVDSKPSKVTPYLLIRKNCAFVPQNERGKQISDEQNLSILMDHWSDGNIDETRHRCSEEGFDLDLLFYGSIKEIKNADSKYSILAEKAILVWFEKLNVEAFKNNFDSNLPDELLAMFFEELKNGIRQTRVDAVIEEQLKEFTEKIDAPIPEKLVSNLIAGILNNYFFSAGSHYFSEDQKRKVLELLKSDVVIPFSNSKIKERLLNDDIVSVKLKSRSEIAKIFESSHEDELVQTDTDDSLPFLSMFETWRDNLTALLLLNAQVTVSKPGNKELGEILNDLEGVEV